MMDAARMNLGKRMRALRRKKMETVKAAMPQGKATTLQGKPTMSWGNGGLK
jgi:hypothetical protein